MDTCSRSSPEREEVIREPDDANTELNPHRDNHVQNNGDIYDNDSDPDRRHETSVQGATHYSLDATPSGEVRMRLPCIDRGLGGLDTGHGSRSRLTKVDNTHLQARMAMETTHTQGPIGGMIGDRVGHRLPMATESMSAGWPAADCRTSTARGSAGMLSSNPGRLGVYSRNCLSGEVSPSSMEVPGQGVRGQEGTRRYDIVPGRSMERMVPGQGLLDNDSSGRLNDNIRGSHFSQSNIGSCRRSPLRHREPATYDGSTSWRDYLIQFEMVAEINRWEEETMALELSTYLRGAAQGVLGDLRPEHRRSWVHLVSALADRFEPTNQSELFRAQIKNRIRRKGEPLSELAQDIKRLVRKAYPSAPAELREQLGRDCFIDSLDDGDMEWTIFQSRPHTVYDALRSALEFEAFQEGRRTNGRQQYVRMQRTEMTGRGSDLLEDPG